MTVLLIVYSDVQIDGKSLAKYFSNWFDAVLMLEVIGCISSSSTDFNALSGICCKFLNKPW